MCLGGFRDILEAEEMIAGFDSSSADRFYFKRKNEFLHIFCRTKQLKKAKKLAHISAKDIIDFYENCNSHALIECHMPGNVQVQVQVQVL